MPRLAYRKELSLCRQRCCIGKKFERVSDKPVAPLVPAVKPVAVPLVPPVPPPSPPLPFFVSVNKTFDKDDWKARRAAFANRTKLAASSRPVLKPFKQRANTQISERAIASVSTKPAEPISEGETVSAIVKPVQPISEGETVLAVVNEASAILAAAGDGVCPQRVPTNVQADREMKVRMDVMKLTQPCANKEPAAVCPPSTTQGRGGKHFKLKKKGDFVKSTVQRIINHYGSREALRSALGQASAMNATVDGTHDQQRSSITESLAIAFQIVSGEKLPLSLLVPPKSLKQAKMRDDWEYWKAAIRAEYEKLVANKTFEIVG